MEVKIVDLLSGLENESWRMRRNCTPDDTDLFLPPPNMPAAERKENETAAKKLCGECVVREECLEEGLSRVNEVGIWGGMTEKERKQLRKSMGRTASR
jgi:WhiB family transcriptional regulator, redox-sensing transcriptional regulator